MYKDYSMQTAGILTGHGISAVLGGLGTGAIANQLSKKAIEEAYNQGQLVGGIGTGIGALGGLIGASMLKKYLKRRKLQKQYEREAVQNHQYSYMTNYSQGKPKPLSKEEKKAAKVMKHNKKVDDYILAAKRDMAGRSEDNSRAQNASIFFRSMLGLGAPKYREP